jgi:hypothetical protein
MKKILSGICATALAATFAVSSVVPMNAAPIFVPRAVPAEAGQSDVVQVQDGMRYRRRLLRRGMRDRDVIIRRDFRRSGDFAFRRSGDFAYYKGFRGYRYRRPGYRFHNGFWFPAGAFIAGALIGGAIANTNRVYAVGDSAHEQWCYDRYRSYREWDNTWQPYNGPRRECISPYM